MALVFGRDAVLGQAWASLVQGDPVLLAGPAGIGKSAIWGELVDRARRTGWLVLTCAPAESESSLALAALADLLRPLTRQVAGLPAPQRTAAEGALLTASVDTAAAYRALAAEADAAGLAEPLSQRFEPDWIEACAAVGDLETARRVLDRLTERHERLPRPWTTLGLARSRALLSAAQGGDTTETVGRLEQARAAVPPHLLPLERARCLLVAGVIHRRARRRGAARTALSGAAAEFAAIGAAAFERRARAELTRIGGRAPASPELTPTEERVAGLAARGQTNRAIAAALFISPKTVEANLARVYHKLKISSRAELGAAMVRRGRADP
ncbi:helix-turn-helix transcriptional regulator [Actinacidiphila sp. ITFR-21]|uniref:helix-turn-helix transcriptional regulator n=1 Tax=Actinacidiphila sp. ITFR-21 TaxID=3075199 RepID=UPI00288AB758|nr:helix-turn-helix transcriptional regulator [Streptomyces sp. ITFR-21]WNI18019.1 helix-turn-helix transcriptional regulator [Streptomyces sp. ITFR-21]